MELDKYREKLGDEMFTELKAGVEKLIGQRDTAVNESITGRKGKQAALDAALNRIAELEDWGGIESGADLKELPPAKGAIEASKQFEAKIKRLERERLEALEKATATDTKYRDSLKRAAVAEAISGHQFVDREVVESFIGQRLAWEGDDLFFKSEDGKLLPVKDGVAGIAKTRPGLLKPTGTGGAGVRQSNAGSGEQGKTMSRAEFETLDQGARMSFAKEGGKVEG